MPTTFMSVFVVVVGLSGTQHLPMLFVVEGTDIEGRRVGDVLGLFKLGANSDLQLISPYTFFAYYIFYYYLEPMSCFVEHVTKHTPAVTIARNNIVGKSQEGLSLPLSSIQKPKLQRGEKQPL